MGEMEVGGQVAGDGGHAGERTRGRARSKRRKGQVEAAVIRDPPGPADRCN